MSQSENPNMVDRISDLADEILCHILSFLSTKQAFTTTLLSKRWNPLCYSLTTLCFDDQTIASYDDHERFLHSIDTLMLSPRVENQSLKTFRLKFRFGISSAKFNAWIEAAKRRRIEEFQCESKYFSYILNPTFLISHTLVVLKLKSLLCQYEKFCADLPLLKTLHLKDVGFKYQNDIKILLNACPNLQDLLCYHVRSENYIEAEEFKSSCLSKLVRADIRIRDYICPIYVPFNAIHNVEDLRVKFASFNMNTGEIFKRISMFQNLIHAELWFYDYFHGWDGIVEFLRHCPKLQILYMRKWDISLSKDWDCPICSPECVSSHLRSCTIVHFEGSKNDLRFATYILQNARVLEVMKICVTAARSSNEIQKRQIMEELSTCPKMSPGCKLSFEFSY